jgi:hypothetical protein
MDALRNLSIRAKLSLALAVVLALGLAVGLFSLRELHRINDATANIRNVWSPKIQTLDDIKRALAEHRLLATSRMQATNFRQVAAVSTPWSRPRTSCSPPSVRSRRCRIPSASGD